jgi:hypothetical protein
MKSIIFLFMMSLIAGVAWAQTPQAENGKVVAMVMGEPVTVKDQHQLSGRVLGMLMERFARDHGIAPTEEEVELFVRRTEEQDRKQQIQFKKDRKRLRTELQSDTLTKRERKNKESHLQSIESILKTSRELKEQMQGKEEVLRRSRRRVARWFVRNWKINKALFQKYGGRVIFQQAGPEPVDAYRDFLREQEKAGAFQIIDEKYKAPFWRYYTNDAIHSFYPDDEGAKFINTPWWMMDPPEE